MWKPIIFDVECIVCNKSLQKISHDPRKVPCKMGKITNRRSRTPNWSLDEKQYLLELIKERKEVIVIQKNSGPNHSEEKDTAWNEILHSLAVRFGSKFSASNIKKVKTQWQNMKRIAREEIALVGPTVEKCTKQSVEVFNILDQVKDGVFKGNDNLNETTLTTDVVIKTERLDEELNQPSTSNYAIDNQDTPQPIPEDVIPEMPRPNHFLIPPPTIEKQIQNINDHSSNSSSSEQSEMNYFEQDEPMPIDMTKKSVSCMTDTNSEMNINAFHKDIQEFFRFTSSEKQLKMDTLKEERCAARALRETAELNKIIAEQKLKHVLWMKKQDISTRDLIWHGTLDEALKQTDYKTSQLGRIRVFTARAAITYLPLVYIIYH